MRTCPVGLIGVVDINLCQEVLDDFHCRTRLFAFKMQKIFTGLNSYGIVGRFEMLLDILKGQVRSAQTLKLILRNVPIFGCLSNIFYECV